MTSPVYTGLSYYCIIFTVDDRKNKFYCVSYDNYCCSLYVDSACNVVVSVGAAPHTADVLAAVAASLVRLVPLESLRTAAYCCWPTRSASYLAYTWTLLSSFWRKRW